jgi:hypothetical protein
MPGRSNRDDKQTPEPGTISSVLHQFGKSLGLVHDDPDPPEDTSAPAAAATPPAKTSAVPPVVNTVKDRGQQIDKAVEDASK